MKGREGNNPGVMLRHHGAPIDALGPLEAALGLAWLSVAGPNPCGCDLFWVDGATCLADGQLFREGGVDKLPSPAAWSNIGVWLGWVISRFDDVRIQVCADYHGDTRYTYSTVEVDGCFGSSSIRSGEAGDLLDVVAQRMRSRDEALSPEFETWKRMDAWMMKRESE